MRERGVEMADQGIRKTHGSRPEPTRVNMPANIRYTTLPSADVLLDPEMVREIVAARNARVHSIARQAKTQKRGGSKS